MRLVLRWTIRTLLAMLGLSLLFVIITVAPVNRSGADKQELYRTMTVRIDSALRTSFADDTATLRVGFGKASITPAYPVATAGYVKRRGSVFNSIRDSVFVRVMAFQKGEVRTALVSLDMLIVPPLLYRRLQHYLQNSELPVEQLYLGATHTHNSIGQWDDHPVGSIFAGRFDPGLVDFLALQVLQALQDGFADLRRVKISSGRIAVAEGVVNRLVEGGTIDPFMHVLVLEREDGTRGVITSYGAHATCLSSGDIRLSSDYPGELVRRLENRSYDFAMFLAGPVGSQAPLPMPDGDEKIHRMAHLLESALQDVPLEELKRTTLRIQRIPLDMPPQQIKIHPDWRVRPWLSEWLLGDPNAALSVFQLGEVILMGTPCDFSGMLMQPVYQKAEENGLQVWVTSFNGGYMGYVTPDELYDHPAYETQIMNWYGSGTGSYLVNTMLYILDRIGN